MNNNCTISSSSISISTLISRRILPGWKEPIRSSYCQVLWGNTISLGRQWGRSSLNRWGLSHPACIILPRSWCMIVWGIGRSWMRWANTIIRWSLFSIYRNMLRSWKTASRMKGGLIQWIYCSWRKNNLTLIFNNLWGRFSFNDIWALFIIDCKINPFHFGEYYVTK